VTGGLQSAGAARAHPVGVGVIGLGFMGRTHLTAYRAAGNLCRVVAVTDRSEARRNPAGGSGGNLATGAEQPAWDDSETTVHADLATLLADPAVEAVSVCTPTDTHRAVAEAALAAGKHVLVEKPVALAAADVRALGRAASTAGSDGAGRVVMPAMCMRFWPGWAWLRERIRAGAAGELGSLTSLRLERLASPPAWSRAFYADEARTGGALFDLHIHDADFIVWCLGTPRAVTSAGTTDHLTTIYRYDAGPRHVVAEGGWDLSPGFPFRMRFTARFEGGTADFDVARERPLMLARAGAYEPVDLPAGTGYDGEVRHFLSLVRGEGTPVVGIEDAAVVAELLSKELESLRTGREVAV